jgi:DNA-binding PadR family transcriptional regulator
MAAGYEITPLTNGTTGEMQQLAQLGLAKNVSQEPNGETYEITPAGRAWLERNKA